jgi:hypothetical protein
MVGTFTQEMGAAMRTIGSAGVADMWKKEKYRNSELVKGTLTTQDRNAINKKYLDDGYKDVEWNPETEAGGDRGMMKALTLHTLKYGSDNDKRALKNQIKNGTWDADMDFKKEISDIVTEKDAQGNTIERAVLDQTQQDKLKELRSMMDNDDTASLNNSLLLNRHLVADYNPALTAAIAKKQLEKGEADPAFVDAFRNAVLRHSKNPKTSEAMVKSTAKKDSFFYDDAKKHKFTPEFVAKLQRLKTAEAAAALPGGTPLTTAEAEELRTLNLSTPVIPQTMTPEARAKRLRELYAMGDISGDPALTAELKQLEQQA